MLYNIEDIEKNIADFEGVMVKLPLPPGKFFNRYSDTNSRTLDSQEVDYLVEKINSYICDNFVPEWIIADNPPPDKLVAYHCKEKRL